VDEDVLKNNRPR